MVHFAQIKSNFREKLKKAKNFPSKKLLLKGQRKNKNDNNNSKKKNKN